MASLANATITYEIRDSTGTTTVNPKKLNLGTSYTAYVIGTSAESISGGTAVGGPSYTVTDYSKISLSDPQVHDTGNLSINSWDAGLNMMLYNVDDLFGPGVSTGDWLSWDITTNALGTFDLNFYDWYASPTTVPVATIPGAVIPEPVTIALLGLGALFLRRRK